jgi:hypothetical protein
MMGDVIGNGKPGWNRRDAEPVIERYCGNLADGILATLNPT